MESSVNLQEDEYLCDRTVKFVESGDLKNIVSAELAEYSVYFEKLLCYHVGKGVIRLPEFLNSQFPLIIEFIRTGKVNINIENVYNLFIAADFLLITKLKFQCFKILNEITNDPSMAIRLWINTKTTFWPELSTLAFEKIIELFETVMNTKEFLYLNAEDVKTIINDNALNCSSENMILEAVSSWISFDKNNRLDISDQLFICVRIELLTDHEIENMKLNKFVRSRPLIMQILNNWPYVPNKGEPNKLFQENQLKLLNPRLPNQVVMVFGGWCEGEGPQATAQVYNPRANEWTLWDYFNDFEFAKIPRRVYAGCVVVEYTLYLIGGFDGITPLKSTLCYNFLTDNGWYETSCMYEKRYYVSVAYTQGFIYAIGGHNGDNHQGRLSTAERFNIKENLWKVISPMNCVRSDASAAALNDQVYVCGGFDGRRYHETAEYYDSYIDQWTFVGRMLSARGGVNLVSHGGYLYAIGGNDGKSRLRSIERFVSENNTWEMYGEMLLQKSNFSTTLVNDDVYILGGWSDDPNSGGILSIVEIFNIPTKKSATLCDLRFPASATCAATLKNKDIVNKYLRHKPIKQSKRIGLHLSDNAVLPEAAESTSSEVLVVNNSKTVLGEGESSHAGLQQITHDMSTSSAPARINRIVRGFSSHFILPPPFTRQHSAQPQQDRSNDPDNHTQVETTGANSRILSGGAILWENLLDRSRWHSLNRD